MNRLTQKDERGSWCLKGVEWEELRVGQVITREISEKLYSALWKLEDYEDTGLTPGEIADLNDFEKTQAAHCLAALQREQRKHQWIPVKERLPEEDGIYLCTLEGELCGIEEPFTGLCGIENGVWDEPDCVIAWMPLQEPYNAK